MDSAFRRSILDLLVSGADLLKLRQWDGPRSHAIKYINDSACVQYHQSKWLGHHYDWRFAKDGVLKSFSTRQIPAVKQAVVALEERDRPLSYLQFSGTIPNDDLEAGKVWLVDLMTMRVVSWTDDEIKLDLVGRSIAGQFILYRESKQKFMMIRSK